MNFLYKYIQLNHLTISLFQIVINIQRKESTSNINNITREILIKNKILHVLSIARYEITKYVKIDLMYYLNYFFFFLRRIYRYKNVSDKINFEFSSIFMFDIVCSYIEHLSDEIFYQIFDYLDGYDIYQAFSNLNNRLENLINSSFMKIQFSSTSELDHHYIQFLISKKHQIFSLHFNNEQILKTFIRLRMIQSFNHLESVILNPVSTYKFLTILFYFVSVPRLSSLTICFNDYLNNLRDIFGVINDLLHLKYLKFKLLSCNIANIAARTSRNEKMTTIKYLVIHFGCAHNQLTNLLFHLPQLIHLTCDYLMKSNNDVELEMVQLNHLMYLDVVIENIDFNEFETFLFKLCYRLKILRIKVRSPDKNYLDENRWDQLILKKMIVLKKFFLTYIDVIEHY